MSDGNPHRLWTPGPWEVRYYEADSAEFDDGIGAWIANHRRKEFIADVIAPKNAGLIAAAPRMASLLSRLRGTIDLDHTGFGAEVDAVLREVGA